MQAGVTLAVVISQLCEQVPAVIDARRGDVERGEGVTEIAHSRRLRLINDTDDRVAVAHRPLQPSRTVAEINSTCSGWATRWSDASVPMGPSATRVM